MKQINIMIVVALELSIYAVNGQQLNYIGPEKIQGSQRNEIAQIAGTATIPQNRTVFANASGYLTSDANYWLWDGTHAKLYQGITNGSGWLQIGNPSNTSDAIELGIQSSVSTGGGIAFSEGSNRAFIRKMGSGSGANLINPALDMPENSYLRIENPNGGIFLKGPNVILGTGGATTDVAVRLTTAGMLIGNNTNMANGPNAKLDVNGAVRMPTITPAGQTDGIDVRLFNGNIVQASSSVEVKENIVNLSFNKDSFLMLLPRRFNWKQGLGGKEDVGFIAEEVAQIIPELAVYDFKRVFDSNGNWMQDTLGNNIIDTTQTVPQDIAFRRLTTYMYSLLKQHEDSILKLNDRILAVENSCCNIQDSIPQQRKSNNKRNYNNDKTFANNNSSTVLTSITLEHTYPVNTVSQYQEFGSVKFHNSGTKYLAMHSDQQTITLYNLDYTLYKTINLPVPSGTTSYGIFYISENLFDTDSSIEYMLGGVLNNNNYVQIYNEDGSLLWEETDCNPGCVLGWELYADPSQSIGPIVNTDNGTKMRIHCNVPSNYDLSAGIIKFYGLPGSMINAQNGLELYDGEIPAQFKIYPNPSGNSATIEYSLTNGENKGEVVITNLMGQVVKKLEVGSQKSEVNKIELDNTQLPAGTYFYQLHTAKGVVGTKKMIVVK